MAAGHSACAAFPVAIDQSFAILFSRERLMPKYFLTAVIAAILLSTVTCREQKLVITTGDETPIVAAESEPQRIISTVPSITEVLFELGLGNRVVGVSDFCNVPEAASSLPRTGGYLNPNYEAMLELKPDLVIVLAESTDLQERLKSFGFTTLVVNHQSIDGILDSFVQIGNRCGAASAEKAHELQAEINRRLETIAKRVAGLERPSVVLTLYFDDGTAMQSTTIAGKNPFFERVLELAGGVNAAQNSTIAFPTVSREGMIELNPDVIIGIADVKANDPQIIDAFHKNWERFAAQTPAVKNKRMTLIAEDYAMVPGPRFVLLLEKITDILHPEATQPPRQK